VGETRQPRGDVLIKKGPVYGYLSLIATESGGKSLRKIKKKSLPEKKGREAGDELKKKGDRVLDRVRELLSYSQNCSEGGDKGRKIGKTREKGPLRGKKECRGKSARWLLASRG